jgi:hypothetical protein
VALEKQTLTFPLFLGRDGGTDKKVVRESLLEAKNVIHSTDGKLSKRPPLHYAGSSDTPLVAATPNFNLSIGKVGETGSTDTHSEIDTASSSMIATKGSFQARRITTMPRQMQDSALGNVAFGPSTTNGDVAVIIASPDGTSSEEVLLDASEGRLIKRETANNVDDSAFVYTSQGLSEITSGGVINVPGVVNGQPGDDILAYTTAAWDVHEDVDAQLRLYAILNDSTGQLSTYLYDESGANSVLIAQQFLTLDVNTRTDSIGIYADTNSFRVYIQGKTGTGNAFKVYYVLVDKTTGAIDDNSGSYYDPPFGFPDCQEVTSYSDLGLITVTGPSTEAYDILVNLLESSSSRNIPRGSKLVTHGFDGNAILYLGASEDKVTANSVTTIGDNPTENSTFVILQGVSSIGYPFYIQEAIVGLNPDVWQPASRPVSYSGEYLVVVLSGATFPVVSLVQIGTDSIGSGRVPTVKYGPDYLAAFPGILNVATGASLSLPSIQSFDLEEGTGGNLTLLSPYGYVVVPIYTGTGGQYLRGAPTAPVTITLSGSNNKVTLTLRREVVGVRPNQYSVLEYQVYRTSIVDGVQSSSYKLVGSIPATDDTFIDTIDDDSSTIALYTEENGDGYSHEPPPPVEDFWLHDGRLWLIPSDSPNSVRYSRKPRELELLRITPAGEGPSFNLLNSISVGIDSIPLRGTSFGGTCLIFTDKETYIIGGSGPNSAGAGTFTDPQALAVPPLDDANSLVNTGNALVYKSKSGWVRLDRGFNSSDIGTPIEDYQSNTVLAAVARTDDTIQVLLDDGITSLVYDLSKSQWFVWEYTATDLTPETLEFGRIVSRDRLDSIAAQSGQYIFEEPQSSVVYRDGDLSGNIDEDYTMAVETRWFNVNQFAGFQRLYELAILGEYKDEHTLTMKIYYDYDETPAETVTITNTEDVTPFLVKWQPKKQVSRAFKVRIEETSPGGTTYESFTLTGFQATIGVKPRTHYTAGETIT